MKKNKKLKEIQNKYRKKPSFRFKNLTYKTPRTKKFEKSNPKLKTDFRKKTRIISKYASRNRRVRMRPSEVKARVSEADTKIDSSTIHRINYERKPDLDPKYFASGQKKKNQQNFLSETKISKTETSLDKGKLSAIDITKTRENLGGNQKTVRDIISNYQNKNESKGSKFLRQASAKEIPTESRKKLQNEIQEALVQNPEIMEEIKNLKNMNKLNFYISDDNVRFSETPGTASELHSNPGKETLATQKNELEFTSSSQHISQNLEKLKREASQMISNLNGEGTLPANYGQKISPELVDVKESDMKPTARRGSNQKKSGCKEEMEQVITPVESYQNFQITSFQNSVSINISLIDKIKNSVANYSEIKKSRIEKILSSRIKKFQEEKKSSSETIVKKSENTQSKISKNQESEIISEKTQNENKNEKKSKNLENPQNLQNSVIDENFYYLSELSYSLAVGANVIEDAAKLGIEYIYEYDETGRNEVVLIEQKDKNERIKKNVFFNHFHHCLQSIAYVSTVDELSEDEFLHKKVYLPPKKNKKLKTLILDLDETLVHCTENLKKAFDFKTPIRFTGGEIIDFGVSIRPNAVNFLKLLSKFFEIVIFTASHSCYANSILNILDPNHEYITFRLFRESCIEIEEGIFVKDLRIFGNRNLDEVMIVDNACYSYAFQIHNGIPIVPYFYGREDTQLLELAGFLITLVQKERKLPAMLNTLEKRNPVCDMENNDSVVVEDGSYVEYMAAVGKACGKYSKAFKENFSEDEKGIRERINWYFKGDIYKVFLENYGEKAPPLIAKFMINHTLEIEKL